jgi:hypothetical protein
VIVTETLIGQREGGGAATGSQSIGEEVVVVYASALIGLFSICGVPAMIVVGAGILIRFVYVMANRDK